MVPHIQIHPSLLYNTQTSPVIFPDQHLISVFDIIRFRILSLFFSSFNRFALFFSFPHFFFSWFYWQCVVKPFPTLPNSTPILLPTYLPSYRRTRQEGAGRGGQLHPQNSGNFPENSGIFSMVRNWGFNLHRRSVINKPPHLDQNSGKFGKSGKSHLLPSPTKREVSDTPLFLPTYLPTYLPTSISVFHFHLPLSLILPFGKEEARDFGFVVYLTIEPVLRCSQNAFLCQHFRTAVENKYRTIIFLDLKSKLEKI